MNDENFLAWKARINAIVGAHMGWELDVVADHFVTLTALKARFQRGDDAEVVAKLIIEFED